MREVAGDLAAGGVDDEDVDRAGGRGEHALGVAREQDALDPRAEADARGRRTAQLLGQPVVAATTADGVLRGLQRVGRELERRAGVVVETAYEPGLDGVVDADRGEALLDPLEVLPARLAEVVDLAAGVGWRGAALR